MNTAPFPALTPRDFVQLLIRRRKLWLAPAIVCGVLAALYSMVMPRYWDASQGLVIRQETAGARGATPGKFADLYEMRTLQETILELAKSQQVVLNTINAVDQRLNGAPAQPTAEDIEKFRKRLKMLPPDGGEFGKTEVFYFSVRDPNRQRAIELVGELCRQLDAGLRDLRSARAAGLVAELEQQVALATEINAAETRRLRDFEAVVGADLGELRMLHSGSSGQSDLRQQAVQLEADQRQFETHVRETEQLLALLKAAQDDPRELIATPNSLLTSQPALRQLKDGLVDAQLTTARLGGNRLPGHPRVRAAAESEMQIRADLHQELVTAIRGAEVDLELGQQRVAAVRSRISQLQARFNRLAEQRAEYANRVAAADNSRVSLDQARQNLNIAKAAHAAAQSGSLVTRLDEPETGPYPAGPGRTVVTIAGAAGGLMLGLALVFLTAAAPVEEPELITPRRRSALHESNSPSPAVVPASSDPTDQHASPPLVAEGPVAPPASADERFAAGMTEPEPCGPAADPAPEQEAAPTFTHPASLAGCIEIPPHRPTSLPTSPGVLPTPAATAPSVPGPLPGNGLSLQEALKAARMAHHRTE